MMKSYTRTASVFIRYTNLEQSLLLRMETCHMVNVTKEDDGPLLVTDFTSFLCQVKGHFILFRLSPRRD